MNKDLQEILSEIRNLLPYITENYSVISVEVFGSYVRNQQDISSDLDILISFSKVPSLLKFLELKNYLSDQLKVNVDLVMKDSLKPRLEKFILSEAISV
ncbi:MAG TPA: nucleotidyltransferase family protein [Ignavibacteriaceae bacterium]